MVRAKPFTLAAVPFTTAIAAIVLSPAFASSSNARIFASVSGGGVGAGGGAAAAALAALSARAAESAPSVPFLHATSVQTLSSAIPHVPRIDIRPPFQLVSAGGSVGKFCTRPLFNFASDHCLDGVTVLM